MTILLDMVGHSCLTAYLSRPMTREETSKLTPAEMHARRLAQVRASRWRLKVAKALARHAAITRQFAHERHPTRDIIDLSPAVIDA